jgi:hypothetical protein
VAEFLVELYVPRVDGGRVPRAGTALRCVRTIFVPEDETCFLLLEAASVDDVRAEFPSARISEAISCSLSTIVTDA